MLGLRSSLLRWWCRGIPWRGVRSLFFRIWRRREKISWAEDVVDIIQSAPFRIWRREIRRSRHVRRLRCPPGIHCRWRLRSTAILHWRRHLRIVSRLRFVLDGRNAAIRDSYLASFDLPSVLCLTKRAQRGTRRNGRHVRRLKVVPPVLSWAVRMYCVVRMMVGHVDSASARLREWSGCFGDYGLTSKGFVSRCRRVCLGCSQCEIE